MSDFDSTEEFSNESDNWESAEDISLTFLLGGIT